jgi:hypothetical protein
MLADALVVNIRLTHPKKLAAEHRVIITLGVIGHKAQSRWGQALTLSSKQPLSILLWLHRA